MFHTFPQAQRIDSRSSNFCLGAVGLNLMPAIKAPHDEPHPGRCNAASVIGGPLYGVPSNGLFTRNTHPA
jgi:hypothetical protein